jgi:hypothetical protein
MEVAMKKEDLVFEPIHENCRGCKKVVKENDVRHCEAYVRPEYWWTNGRHCPLRPTGMMGIGDIAKMGLKEGVFGEEGGVFTYGGRKIAKSVGGVTQFLKSDKSALASVKKSLGIHDGDTEQGKMRVGQQKQKKNKRF